MSIFFDRSSVRKAKECVEGVRCQIVITTLPCTDRPARRPWRSRTASYRRILNEQLKVKLTNWIHKLKYSSRFSSAKYSPNWLARYLAMAQLWLSTFPSTSSHGTWPHGDSEDLSFPQRLPTHLYFWKQWFLHSELGTKKFSRSLMFIHSSPRSRTSSKGVSERANSWRATWNVFPHL